jgi:hypothetical protein
MRLGTLMIPNDGKAAGVVRRWRATGRTLTDLVVAALEEFEESAEYKRVVAVKIVRKEETL